jgi:hypothetical protein
MQTATRVSLVLLFCTAIWGNAASPQQVTVQAGATVEVLAFDETGNTIDGVIVETFEFMRGSSNDLAPLFRNGVAERIPFGVYRMRASVPGFYSTTRNVSVFSSKTTVVVGLAVGDIIFCGPCSEGSLNGTHAFRGQFADVRSKNTRARLIGAHYGFSQQTKLDRKGSFEFHKLFTGRYYVVIYDDNFILATEEIQVRSGPSTQPHKVHKDRSPFPITRIPRRQKTRSNFSGHLSGSVKLTQGAFIRMAALFSDEMIESRIDATGTFQIEGLLPGPYLYLIGSDAKVYDNLIEMPLAAPLDIVIYY